MFENLHKELREGKGVIISFAVTIAILVSLLLLTKILTEVKSYEFIGSGVVAQDTISVSGTGEAFAVPDIAQISFSVVEEGKTVTEAQSVATKEINDAISFLRDNNIEEKDIKTTSYNVYPRYEYIKDEAVCMTIGCPTPGQKRVLVGYEVSQTISVKIRDTESAGQILAGVGELGVTNISGLNFQIDDEEVVKREARKKAISDAKNKAAVISRDLGVELSRIVSFSESGNYPMYKTFGVEMMSMDGIGGAPAPQIPMGENKVTSTVTITYEIK